MRRYLDNELRKHDLARGMRSRASFPNVRECGLDLFPLNIQPSVNMECGRWFDGVVRGTNRKVCAEEKLYCRCGNEL